MNMKKSIAGVMAGAMAVSAMAATVSADQDSITLNYDLKTYVRNVGANAAKVQVIASYENALVPAAAIKAGSIHFEVDNGFITGDKVLNGKKYELWDSDGVASMCDFEFSARPYKDTVTGIEALPLNFKASGSALLDGSLFTQKLDDSKSAYIETSKSSYDMPITIIASDAKDKYDLSGYDILALGYCEGKINNLEAIGYTADDISATSPYYVDGMVYGMRNAVAKMTYKLPAIVEINGANGWTFSTTDSETIANSYLHETLKTEAQFDEDLFTCGFFYKDADGNLKKKAMISNVNDGVTTKVVASSLGQPTTITLGSFTKADVGESIYPFKTTLKPKTVNFTKDSNWGATNKGYVAATGNNENDVIDALESRKAGGNYYTKPIAVINDAIANHSNVTFQFTSFNGHVATEKSVLLNEWVSLDQAYDYDTSKGKGFDWYNPTFGQHLYAPSYYNDLNHYSLFDTDDYDNYGSYSSAWGINLFTGAVVVNNNLTMQLSDTDVFDWGNNSLTFDWFDITDEGKITDAKTFLTSMLLYTPVDWYWDSLTVVVSDEEDEAVDAGEGLDGEGEVIEDEPEEIVEEEPEDVVEEEPEVVETEAAPVETRPSPDTGNAPVALAVIPVALAAAAVVAKKRG